MARDSRRAEARRRGFSLLELVLVVILLGIFAGALAPGLARRHADARDTRRLADMQVLAGAIEQYHLENGAYPAPRPTVGHGEWETSLSGAFLAELVREGFLRELVADPLNDERYHYVYAVYPASAHGCNGGPFYVLGARRLETDKHAQNRRALFRCSGRDWSAEFAYATGGGTRGR